MIRIGLLSLVFCVHAGVVAACACCADQGERFTSILPRDAYLQSTLEDLEGDGIAQVFVTACDLECVRGLDPMAYAYSASLTFDADRVLLDAGGTGEISLRLPDHLTRFSVDPTPFLHDVDVAHTTTLYTELRLSGTASASGAFRKADGASVEVILGGRGNHCVGPESFTHWHMIVSSDMADFKMFGRFLVK